VDAADSESTSTPSIVQLVDTSQPPPTAAGVEDGIVSGETEDSLVRLVESPLTPTEPPADSSASLHLQLVTACRTCDVDIGDNDTELAICAYYPSLTGQKTSGADVSTSSEVQSAIDMTSVSTKSQSDSEPAQTATTSTADEPLAASATASTSTSTDDPLAAETVVKTTTGAGQPVLSDDSDHGDDTVSVDSEALQTTADDLTSMSQLSASESGKFTYNCMIHYHSLMPGF